jgi:hypothetical protein
METTMAEFGNHGYTIRYTPAPSPDGRYSDALEISWRGGEPEKFPPANYYSNSEEQALGVMLRGNALILMKIQGSDA